MNIPLKSKYGSLYLSSHINNRRYEWIFDTGSDGCLFPEWLYPHKVDKSRKVRVLFMNSTEYLGWRNQLDSLTIPGLGRLRDVPVTVLNVKDPYKAGKKEVYCVEQWPLLSASFLWGRTFCLDLKNLNIKDVPPFDGSFKPWSMRLLRENRLVGMYIRLPVTIGGKQRMLILDTGLLSAKLILNAREKSLPRRDRWAITFPGTNFSGVFPTEYSAVLASDVDGLISWHCLKGYKIYIDTVRDVGQIEG